MSWILLIGRVLFGGFFLYSGISHFLSVAQMAGYASEHGVPMARQAVMVSGALLLAGGLSVLMGFLPRVGLALIVTFLVPVTLTMHAFWAVGDPQARMMEMANFFKNLGLLGGALGMMAIGVPWPYSIDVTAPRTTRTRLGRPIPH
jgi:putative oxidoreductase